MLFQNGSFPSGTLTTIPFVPTSDQSSLDSHKTPWWNFTVHFPAATLGFFPRTMISHVVTTDNTNDTHTQLIGAKLLCVWWYFVSGCQLEKAANVPFHLEFHWAYQALTTVGARGHDRHCVLTMSYKFLELKEVKRVPHIEVIYPLLPNPPGPLLMFSPPNFIDFFSLFHFYRPLRVSLVFPICIWVCNTIHWNMDNLSKATPWEKVIFLLSSTINYQLVMGFPKLVLSPC